MRDRRSRELTPASPSRVFGLQVSEARRRKRPAWSQTDLARELEKIGSPIDRAALQKIEQGARKGVTLEEVIEIAAALDVNPVQLFLPLEDPPLAMPNGYEDDEWTTLEQIASGHAGPLVQVTPTIQRRAQELRNFFYGYSNLSAGFPDPSLYRAFISDPEQRLRDETAGRGSAKGEGRKRKPVYKKRPKKGEQ